MSSKIASELSGQIFFAKNKQFDNDCSTAPGDTAGEGGRGCKTRLPTEYLSAKRSHAKRKLGPYRAAQAAPSEQTRAHFTWTQRHPVARLTCSVVIYNRQSCRNALTLAIPTINFPTEGIYNSQAIIARSAQNKLLPVKNQVRYSSNGYPAYIV